MIEVFCRLQLSTQHEMPKKSPSKQSNSVWIRFIVPFNLIHWGQIPKRPSCWASKIVYYKQTRLIISEMWMEQSYYGQTVYSNYYHYYYSLYCHKYSLIWTYASDWNSDFAHLRGREIRWMCLCINDNRYGVVYVCIWNGHFRFKSAYLKLLL